MIFRPPTLLVISDRSLFRNAIQMNLWRILKLMSLKSLEDGAKFTNAFLLATIVPHDDGVHFIVSSAFAVLNTHTLAVEVLMKAGSLINSEHPSAAYIPKLKRFALFGGAAKANVLSTVVLADVDDNHWYNELDFGVIRPVPRYDHQSSHLELPPSSPALHQLARPIYPDTNAFDYDLLKSRPVQCVVAHGGTETYRKLSSELDILVLGAEMHYVTWQVWIGSKSLIKINCSFTDDAEDSEESNHSNEAADNGYDDIPVGNKSNGDDKPEAKPPTERRVSVTVEVPAILLASRSPRIRAMIQEQGSLDSLDVEFHPLYTKELVQYLWNDSRRITSLTRNTSGASTTSSKSGLTNTKLGRPNSCCLDERAFPQHGAKTYSTPSIIRSSLTSSSNSTLVGLETSLNRRLLHSL